VALGFTCPECGSDGEHTLMAMWQEEDTMFFTLHCRSCEHTWTEE
jgi:DNA-directed RNA polymerase subunit M/transcription elongation factor TFIIS